MPTACQSYFRKGVQRVLEELDKRLLPSRTEFAAPRMQRLVSLGMDPARVRRKGTKRRAEQGPELGRTNTALSGTSVPLAGTGDLWDWATNASLAGTGAPWDFSGDAPLVVPWDFTTNAPSVRVSGPSGHTSAPPRRSACKKQRQMDAKAAGSKGPRAAGPAGEPCQPSVARVDLIRSAHVEESGEDSIRLNEVRCGLVVVLLGTP